MTRDAMVLRGRRTEAFLKAGHAAFSDGPVTFEQEPYLCQHLASLNICDVQLSSPVRPSMLCLECGNLRSAPPQSSR